MENFQKDATRNHPVLLPFACFYDAGSNACAETSLVRIAPVQKPRINASTYPMNRLMISPQSVPSVQAVDQRGAQLVVNDL